MSHFGLKFSEQLHYVSDGRLASCRFLLFLLGFFVDGLFIDFYIVIFRSTLFCRLLDIIDPFSQTLNSCYFFGCNSFNFFDKRKSLCNLLYVLYHCLVHRSLHHCAVACFSMVFTSAFYASSFSITEVFSLLKSLVLLFFLGGSIVIVQSTSFLIS